MRDRKNPLYAAFGIAVVGLLTLSGCSVAGSYVEKGKEKLSADHVEQEFTRVMNNWESLYSAAENACLAQSSAGDNSPTFVESPEQAYAGTFRKIVADYNRRQANIFEANVVGPPGYPKEIPRSLGSDGDWCSVPLDLDNLK